jgi:hypothetical protein
VSRYKVWHIPQVPGKAFEVESDDLRTAVLILDTLAFYDLFQFEQRIKPDYSNAGGISEWDAAAGEWVDVDEYDFEAVR